ncbi:MAG: hypothetical protein R2708_07825 [Vicinamibacterales bacterium]
MPPWVQEGGYAAWAQRLRDPKVRDRVRREMTATQDEWENLMQAAGAEGTLLVGFKNEALRIYTGKTLAEVAKLRNRSVQDTAMDLVAEDGSRVQVVYFLMSEDNVKKQIRLPWVSFGSDASSMAAEGVFLKTSTHPRAYGNPGAPARRSRPRGARHPARGGHPEADVVPGRHPADHGARPARARLLRRCRGLRPGHHRRTCHLRAAPPVRHWDAARVGQRRPGAEGRRAHRRDARARRARARVDGCVRRRHRHAEALGATRPAQPAGVSDPAPASRAWARA